MRTPGLTPTNQYWVAMHRDLEGWQLRIHLNPNNKRCIHVDTSRTVTIGLSAAR